MEPRQLFNIHKLCIVKHASKVSYMQPNRTLPTHTTHTLPTPINPYTLTIHTNYTH